ncbi:unnamed protein product [Schistosoma margrebowiei]|uniref:Uncharacterized protein n=1 Tax=Schistosoma margrebowiei TaxID=48269 RepID=A0A183LRL7_9TREM|nr:unnamed protein product [Schistosoma margrebowiei]
MENVQTSRGADIASYRHLLGGCQDETEANEVLNKWTNSITKVQYSLSSTYRKTQRIQDSSQQQIPILTGSTEGRKYNGGQLERDQRSTKFNVSEGCGPQEASS